MKIFCCSDLNGKPCKLQVVMRLQVHSTVVHTYPDVRLQVHNDDTKTMVAQRFLHIHQHQHDIPLESDR